MNLSRHAREYYQLEIVTEPDVPGGWEASFDQGETWVNGSAATVGGGVPVIRWLLAGPEADLTNAVPIVGDITPLVRAVDVPELLVRKAPPILVF
jgi:hypothetical protein